MKAQGVPIEGAGDQGHLDTQFGFPSQLTQDLQQPKPAFTDLQQDLKLAADGAPHRTGSRSHS
jgi:GH35 family endo-1,4-beta-xylanase